MASGVWGGLLPDAAKADALRAIADAIEAATPQIEEWMGKQRRSMTPKRVVVEPNHNRFNRAYWVDIDTAGPLA